MVRLLNPQRALQLDPGPDPDGNGGASPTPQVGRIDIGAGVIYFCDPGSGFSDPVALARATAEFTVSEGTSAILLRNLRIWRAELDRFLIEAVFEKLLSRKSYLPSDGTVLTADSQDIRALTTLFHLAMICEWDIECYCDGPFQALTLASSGVLEFHFQNDPAGFPDAFEEKTGHRLNVMRAR